MFNSLLALNGRKHRVMPFVVNEEFDSVSLREACCCAFTVFKSAPHKIIGDANIKYAAWLAGQNVNPEARQRGEAIWIAGSSPAMTF